MIDLKDTLKALYTAFVECVIKVRETGQLVNCALSGSPCYLSIYFAEFIAFKWRLCGSGVMHCDAHWFNTHALS